MSVCTKSNRPKRLASHQYPRSLLNVLLGGEPSEPLSDDMISPWMRPSGWVSALELLKYSSSYRIYEKISSQTHETEGNGSGNIDGFAGVVAYINRNLDETALVK